MDGVQSMPQPIASSPQPSLMRASVQPVPAPEPSSVATMIPPSLTAPGLDHSRWMATRTVPSASTIGSGERLFAPCATKLV